MTKKIIIIAKKIRISFKKTIFAPFIVNSGMTYRLHNIVLAVTALFAYAAAAAQSPLKFDRTEWDFGTIREADGSVSYTFEFTNRSDKPVVIDEASASCGCTLPEFSREPVLAGSRGRLKVTFDPTNRPGSFSKEITVSTGGRRYRTVLRIKGDVIGRTKTVEELYPIDAGCGLRLDAVFLPFAYVTQGASKQLSVGYVNTSSRTLTLRVRVLSASGWLRYDLPQTVEAGARGRATFTYSVPASSGYFGRLDDILEISAAGCDDRTKISTSGIAVEAFDANKRDTAPQALLEQQLLKFGEVGRRSSPVTLTVELKNTGAEPLVIRSVQPSCDAITTSLRAGDGIAPNGGSKFTVTIDPSELAEGRAIERITIVTNDPDRPMRQLRITGVVR